jgi:cytidylate kinase
MSIVTIARGTGIGGKAVAERLAEQLGYPCLSREGLLQATREYGVPLEDLRAAMETPPSFWERVTGARRMHLGFVQAALCNAAVGGRLVYYGHAGHLLLPGVSHVFRVRVIADLADRIAAVMAEQHLSRAAAATYVEQLDRERHQWVRFLFDVDWTDPHLYDLVLHLGHMQIETACAIIAQALEGAEFQVTPASQQDLEDLRLASDIWARLAVHPRTQEADLRIVAEHGVVTVTGTAPLEEIREAVPEVTRQAAGVTDVQTDIIVVPMAYDTMPY